MSLPRGVGWWGAGGVAGCRLALPVAVLRVAPSSNLNCNTSPVRSAEAQPLVFTVGAAVQSGAGFVCCWRAGTARSGSKRWPVTTRATKLIESAKRLFTVEGVVAGPRSVDG